MKKIPAFADIHKLHQEGRLDAAKKGYLKIIKADNKNIEALHFLAILLAQQDNLVDAVEYIKIAIQYQPNNPVLQLHLSNMLKAQGFYHQAEKNLLHLIELFPDYIPALNNLGTVYFALEKYDLAEKYYQQAIAKKSDYVDAYYNLGLALLKQNKNHEALIAFKSVLDFAPQNSAAHFQCGCIYMAENNFDDAIHHFLAIDKEHPYHLETQTNLANAYLKQNNLNEAKKYFLKTLELNPNDIQNLFNLGVILMQQGQWDEAIQYYQKAIKVNPDFFDAHNNLGVAFIAKQHIGFAIKHFKEALRLQPDNKAIQYTVQMLSQDQRLMASPPEYVKNLFDFYADHYEKHLLKTLEYQMPELFYSALAEVSSPPSNQWDIVDLGCGTGLCGIPLKAFARTLIGVDLSQKMLDIASEKNIYDTLINQSMEDFLKNNEGCYDLIIAGDSLVYIGDLQNIFADIHRILKPNALFIFNLEINENENYTMTQSGRFAHTQQYIDQLANANHFNQLLYKIVITRLQDGQPVYGHLYVLQSK